MNNKYLIIKCDGSVEEVAGYISHVEAGDEFAAFVRKEALGEGPEANRKSDYLEYAHKLGFGWELNADAGFVSYGHKAWLIMRLMEEYARSLVQKIGVPVYEVRGSNMFDLSHPVVEAYAKLYGDRLFNFKAGKKQVVMSYDASYPQFNLAGSYSISSRQLPFAHFSVADCYRYEQSGECMLLYRQRRFYMPDLHPYFKDVNEAFAWFPRIERQIVQAGAEAGVQYQVVVEVSSEQNWQRYREEIVSIAKNLGRDVLVAILQDGKDRYWIINVDYKLMDKFGQSREIACIQIDVGNAARLGIRYADGQGGSKEPVIIHSAVPGGIERYVYMLLDDFKNRFPLWLLPAQVRLLPVNQSLVLFCEQLAGQFSNVPVRMEIDDRAESVGKKIKMAHEDLVPFPIVIGEREQQLSGVIPVLQEAIDKVVASAQDKPFLPLGYPLKVSQQIQK